MRHPNLFIAATTLACAVALTGCGRSAPDSGGAVPAAAARGVRLAPDPAFSSSRIEVVFDDPWIDRSKSHFEWRRNGAYVSGAHDPFLDPSKFRKGERIAVRVTVEGVSGVPSREFTAEVEVVNTPPRLGAVGLSFTAAERPEIVARIDASDPDQDALAFTYRWFKNGQPFPEAIGASLPAAGVGREDQLVLEVVASDGDSESPAVRSEAFTLHNMPPRFSSQPMLPDRGDVDFTYALAADDPDGDRLKFELMTAPPGMQIDSRGVLSWRLPPVAARWGDAKVVVRATDGRGGEAIQEFSIPLEALR